MSRRRDIPGLSAAGCLALLWPALPSGLLPLRTCEKLWRAAGRLPPVPRVALELRLGGDASATVDLHQMITVREGDPEILREWLDGRPADALGPVLTGFLRSWADNEQGMRDWFAPLYLEWDAPVGDAPAVPAVFLAVDPGRDTAPDRDQRRTCALDAAARFFGNGVMRLAEPIIEMAQDGIWLSHLGLFLGRGDMLRVNLKGIRPALLPHLLGKLGWKGDLAAAATHFATLVERADRVTVALDLAAGTTLPSIGFEVFLDHPSRAGPRWPHLVEYFYALGLCTEDERAGLLTLGTTATADAKDQLWPAAWIVQTAAAPQDVRPRFEAGLSHLKLSLDGNGKASAKAYVSAEHFWNIGVPSAQPARADAATRPLAVAKSRATDFLLSERLQGGLWSDFNSGNGGSNIWVAAAAARALLKTGNPPARGLAEDSARTLLRFQQDNGGWGHNACAPADSDSTASVVKLLEEVDEGRGSRDRARSFILAHLVDDGLTAYAPGTAIRFLGGETDDRGWRSNHLCVVGNCAAFAPDLLLPVLRNGQNDDGSWTPYWWRTRAYAVALAAEALAVAGDRVSVGKAVAWGRRQGEDVANAFDAAQLVRLLGLGDIEDRAAAARILRLLARAQLADGSWPTSAAMLQPSPQHGMAREDAFVVLDERRNFTTAAVLSAIIAHENLDGPAPGGSRR